MKNRAIHVNLPVITALACIAAGSASAQQIVPSLEWQRFYFDSACDISAVLDAGDGGYILGGGIYDNADELPQNDCIVVKIDSQGEIIWEKIYGGNKTDTISSMLPTADGGYIFTAYTDSPPSGNKESPRIGGTDAWVVKLDALGNKEWERSFGGADGDFVNSIWKTMDGAYALAGSSPGPFGGSDGWLLKFDDEGNKHWEHSYGGDRNDFFSSIRQTADGTYLVAGGSYSAPSGNKEAPHFGGRDGWLVKVDAEGNKLWDQAIGGSAVDSFGTLDQSAGGGYILGGSSGSPPSGNKESPHFGGLDYWVVKVDAEGNKKWEQSYGTEVFSEGISIVRQTMDGGFIAGGMSQLIKLDSGGQLEWRETLGIPTARRVNLRDLLQAEDGGYVVGGSFDIPVGLPSEVGCSYGSWVAKLKTVVSRSGEVVYWNSNAGTVLESAENLNGEWESAQTEVLSIGDAGAIPLVPAGHQRFYRLKADASSDAPTLEFGTLLTWPAETNHQLIYSPNHDATWESYPGDQGNIGGTNYAIIPRNLQQHYFRTQIQN